MEDCNQSNLKGQSTRKIEDSLRAELEAAQKLLALQQHESYKSHNHVQILEHELDTIHVLLEGKQKVINQLKDTIVAKDDEITQLNQSVHENQIDRHALKTFETQNKFLHDELTDRMKQMEALEIELRFIQENSQDKSSYNDDRAKRVAAMDIVLTGTIASLKLDLEAARKDGEQKQSEIERLQKVVKDLNSGLWLSEEHRRDQVARSRQSEYRTLAKLQAVSESYSTAQDDNEMLLDTVRMQNTRGNSLQKQLDRSIQSLDSSQELFGAIVDHVESRSELARMNEGNLAKENEALQAEVQVLRMTVEKLQSPPLRKFKPRDMYDYSTSPYSLPLISDTLITPATTTAAKATMKTMKTMKKIKVTLVETLLWLIGQAQLMVATVLVVVLVVVG